MPTFEAGQVFDRYHIIRWLGSGVSGESYEAEDSILLRKVTLKLIHPQEILPDSARRQFFREMQGISALNHPYIAAVLDYGEINGRLYVARRYVSNGSLLGAEGRLWYRPPLNISEAIRYTHQIAQALHSIHLRGYVHGAVTFSNILVLRGPDLDNQPDNAPFLLADVGLAQFERRFGQQRQQPLLPLSAAPEQLGRRLIPASDQFALAVLLYFWLAGRPPYVGTPEEVERLKLTETITPLSTINTRVTIEQDGMLLRALSVFPEDRYPTVLAFAEALLGSIANVPAAPQAPEEEITISSPEPSASPTSPEPEAGALESPVMQETEAVSPESPASLEAVVPESPPSPELELVVPESPVMQESPAEPVFSSAQDTLSQQAEEAPPEPQEAASEPAEEAPPELQEATPEPEEAIAAQAGEAASPDRTADLLPMDTPVPPVETPGAPSPEHARVIITSPYTDDLLEVPLNLDEMTVGRAGSSDILLDHDNLTSRHHAFFRRENQRYVVYDRHSANGVFVNGQKIGSEEGFALVDGDHISIGNYELIFRSSLPENTSQDGRDAEPSAQQEMTQLI